MNSAFSEPKNCLKKGFKNYWGKKKRQETEKVENRATILSLKIKQKYKQLPQRHKNRSGKVTMYKQAKRNKTKTITKIVLISKG